MPERGALWKTARRLVHALRLERKRWGWLRRNRHNETWAVNSFDITHVKVGRNSYGPLSVVDGDGPARLTVGSFCSIADRVTFVLNGDHHIDRFTTLPVRAFVLGLHQPALSKGDIVLEDDVWIGHGATILSGVRIGAGSVVAAGAVVSRNVPPNVIVGGVPARVLRPRFETRIAARVQDLRRMVLNESFVRDHLDFFERPLSEQLLDNMAESVDRGVADG